jgi:hypothetical protein
MEQRSSTSEQESYSEKLQDIVQDEEKRGKYEDGEKTNWRAMSGMKKMIGKMLRTRLYSFHDYLANLQYLGLENYEKAEEMHHAFKKGGRVFSVTTT